MKKTYKKVVLAYSGGLDTSIIISWLKENYGCEVIAVAADVGQDKELTADPYCQAEERFMLTRMACECVLRHGFHLHICTKSDMILRDIDIFKRYKQQLSVSFSFTAFNEKTALALEPRKSIFTTTRKCSNNIEQLRNRRNIRHLPPTDCKNI